jgi:hypothetical protein
MEMLTALDRQAAAAQAEQQRTLIAELIAVQARLDARFAALWDLETKLLARIQQGPPSSGSSTTMPTPAPTILTTVTPTTVTPSP